MIGRCMTFPFQALSACHAELEAEATLNDGPATFPAHGLDCMRRLGVLSAPLPRALGGQGFGTEPTGAAGLQEMLRLVGHASLALGRIVEGHVNALRLIARYGTPARMAQAAQAVHDGALFGVWVTDGTPPLAMQPGHDGIVLHGSKAFASGVGHVTHALVTAATPAGDVRMLVVDVTDAARVQRAPDGLAGMRGAGTGRYDFTGMAVQESCMVGQAGDYLCQPEFSAGAWRAMAVALGGIERLAHVLRTQLAARGRAQAPAQLARIGHALIAVETAFMWTRRAATLAETPDPHAPGDIAATVNLARLAVERAGLEVIELVQRGLGLSAFVRANVAERLLRDLATYLRQPAPDEALCEAAAWFTHRDLPRVAEQHMAGLA